jgi:hypothetical protein
MTNGRSAGPRQPDRAGEDGDALLDEAAGPLGPGRVVGPGADRHVERPATDLDGPRRRRERAGPVGDEVGEERQRLGERAGREDRPALAVGRRLAELVRAGVDRVARREHDRDGAAGHPLAGVCPRPE